MAERLGLKNVKAFQARAESIPQKFDFVTGARGQGSTTLHVLGHPPVSKTGSENGVEKGVIYLKGGDLSEEYKTLGMEPSSHASLLDYYPGHDFFDTKYVLHFSAQSLLNTALGKSLVKPSKSKKKFNKKRR